jgi:hypothetical protein
MKADFWLRNPDYLADELLSELEAGRRPAETVFPNVIRMLGGKEPFLHRYPMAKFLFGAYERPDNALAILKSMGLMTHRRICEGMRPPGGPSTCHREGDRPDGDDPPGQAIMNNLRIIRIRLETRRDKPEVTY